jgi:membrane-associated protease RseP (regulator of RpoE activity)
MAEEEEFKRVQFWYGITMLRTKRFQSIMDHLGSRRITKPAAWVLLFLMPVGCAFGLYLFLSDLRILLSPTGAVVASYIRTLSPLGNLGLPGINPYLPIVDGWIALLVGVIVHEGAHGVVARSLGLRVKSSGMILLLFLPIGFFVDVDEDALRKAKARDFQRVLGAGAGINLVVGLVCLALLLSLVSTMTPAVNGIAVTSVYQQSPAATHGIKPGDYITYVDGQPVSNPQTINGSSWYKPGQLINITLWRQGEVIQLLDVRLSNITLTNTKTNQTYERAFLGVNDASASYVQSLASSYASSFFKNPFIYMCIPTLPRCQDNVPFSDALSPFYTSPVGNLLPALANLLYWLFFLNFNLALFNALPIYPLDGGQAFLMGVKTLGGKRLSEKGAMAITVLATAAVAGLILFVVAGPYFFSI